MSENEVSEKSMIGFLDLIGMDLSKLYNMKMEAYKNGKNPSKILIPSLFVLGLEVEFSPNVKRLEIR